MRASDPKLPRDQRPSFDHGLLHLVFFPPLGLHQQFAVRRWAGIAAVFGLFLIGTAPWLIAFLVFFGG